MDGYEAIGTAVVRAEEETDVLIVGGSLVGLRLDRRIIGDGDLADPDGRFPEAYGISATGAVIRPDDIVAWRAIDATGVSLEAIHDVLASLTCRP
jgi:hypothetical protein